MTTTVKQERWLSLIESGGLNRAPISRKWHRGPVLQKGRQMWCVLLLVSMDLAGDLPVVFHWRMWKTVPGVLRPRPASPADDDRRLVAGPRVTNGSDLNDSDEVCRSAAAMPMDSLTRLPFRLADPVLGDWPR